MKRLLSLPALIALSAGALAAPARAETPNLLAGPIYATAPTPCTGPACGVADAVVGHDDPAQAYVRAEYLLWWLKGAGTVPLLTTDAAGPNAGALGNPGTRILNDGQGLVRNPFSGARFTAGTYLGDDAGIGVEGSYLFLNSRGTRFNAASDGTTVLARPYFSTNLGIPTSEVIAFPGQASGTFALATTSRLDGYEANVFAPVSNGCNGRVEVLGGFRQLHLGEGLYINEDVQSAPGAALFPGSRFLVRDQFETNNDFYGGQVGVRGEYRTGRLSFAGVAKVALGVTNQESRILGTTTIIPPGGVGVVAPGGLLALPSNSGQTSVNRFAVLPEVGLNVGYQLTTGLSVRAGYSALYLSSVARPGDQVNPRLNDTQVPTNAVTGGQLIGAPSPVGGVRSSDVWVQGLTLGLELRF